MNSFKRKKTQISDSASKEDPLAALGYGIVSYVNIMYVMFWVFLGFTILLIPTMQAFNAGTMYENDAVVGYAGGTLGNLGYSSVQCHNIPISLGSLAINCKYGTVGSILDYGVND